MRPLMLSVAVVFAANLVVSVAAAADDDATYQIKNAKFTAKDKALKVNDKVIYTTSIKVADQNGKVLSDKKAKEKTVYRSFVEKTLEGEKDKRTKFSREYTKAKDVEGDESETKSYHGQTVIYEGGEGKWKLSGKGDKEVSKEDLKELTDEVNKPSDRAEKALYPGKAVKVGATWQLPAKDVSEFFKELNINEKSFKGEGKLLKVYKKGDQQWGSIQYGMTFEAPLGEIKTGKGEIKGTIEQPIDGSSTAGKVNLQLTLAGTQQVEQNCMKFDVTVTVRAVITSDHDDSK